MSFDCVNCSGHGEYVSGFGCESCRGTGRILCSICGDGPAVEAREHEHLMLCRSCAAVEDAENRRMPAEVCRTCGRPLEPEDVVHGVCPRILCRTVDQAANSACESGFASWMLQ